MPPEKEKKKKKVANKLNHVKKRKKQKPQHTRQARVVLYKNLRLEGNLVQNDFDVPKYVGVKQA